jgi:hypothetical protein
MSRMVLLLHGIRKGGVIPCLFTILSFGGFTVSSATAGDPVNKLNRAAESITNTMEVINGLTGETSRQVQSVATQGNEILNTVKQPGSVSPPQPVNPPKKKKVASVQGTTNCYPFDPSSLTVSEFKSGLGLTDSTHPGRSFATFRKERQNDADMALQAIRNYGMNQVCYTPGLILYLVSGQAAQGNFQSERCLSFDPNNLTLEPQPRKARGSEEVLGTIWSIMSGPQRIFGFVDNEPTARTALATIQQYGFTNSCFAGFPYLRR